LRIFATFNDGRILYLYSLARSNRGELAHTKAKSLSVSFDVSITVDAPPEGPTSLLPHLKTRLREVMSLHVALQSVAFYVLSCSTCTKIYHRHKAKQVAKRERAEKQALEMEQPGLYRHPAPFCTNPYWDEEITLGPGPPKRKVDKGGSKNPSTRALTTAGKGSSVTSSGCISTDPGSSPTMVSEDQRLSGDNWNRKRYQREDEELWGNDTQKASQRIKNALAKAESSVGSTLRMIEGRLSKSGPSREETSPYLIARNPPVNDLHPPVVSTQASIGATRWMLQPPPSAKVMEGKERANRSRSGSRGSSRRGGGDATSLSRQVAGRAVGEKLRRGETPSDLELDSRFLRPDSRTKTARSPSPAGQHLDLRRSSVDSLTSSDGGIRRKKKPPPFPIVTDRTCTIEHNPHNSGGLSPKSGNQETVYHKPASPLPLQEVPFLARESALNSMTTSPTSLSPSTKLKPTSPTTRSKFPGAETYRFPPRREQENDEPVGGKARETA
jgi:hypothetical protein